MKKTFLRTTLFSLALTAALGTAANAQSTDNSDDNKTYIRIEIIGKADGKTQVVERSYRVDAMSENEQKAFIDKALDSLAVDGMSQKRISITVDDNDRRQGDVDFHFDTRELEGSVRRMQEDMEPKLREFQKNMEPKLRELRRDMEPSLRVMQKKMEGVGDRFGDAWGSAFDNNSTVRSLNAYANNPDNGLLNLRFSVPDTGDVRITVTDTDGKEVGKKTIRDFSGEFVGQIELKKNTKGTLFVTVVQNDAGTVRKVVIK